MPAMTLIQMSTGNRLGLSRSKGQAVMQNALQAVVELDENQCCRSDLALT